MAVVKMEKIRLIVHRIKTSEVLGILQKMGAVHFNEITPDKLEGLKKEEKKSFELDYVSSRLDFVVNFLLKYDKPPFLKNIFEDNRPVTNEEEMKKLAQEFHYKEVIDKVSDIEERINNAKNRIETLKEEERILKEWEALDIPLSSQFETKSTKTILLSGKEKEIEKIKKELEENFPLLDFKKVSASCAVLAFLKNEEQEIKETINLFKVEEISLPKREKSPKEELEKINKERKEEDKKIDEAEKEARVLTRDLPKIKILSDYMRWKKEKHNLLTDTYGTKNNLFFEGWCPEKKLPSIRKKIKESTNLFEIEQISPDENEDPPVEIENEKAVRPFESITRLYGLPHHKDLDPTPFLAGFFFLFFGFCLSDFGYGLFITLVTLTIILSYRLGKEFKLFLSLIMLGGVSSMIFGVLFGGYLGIEPTILPAFLQDIQKFDPIASPLTIFYLALILGVIQVVFGVILRMIKEAKNEGILDSVLNNGPWLFLFFSLGILGAAGSYEPLNNLPFEAKWLAYLALAFIILTQGRKESSIFKKFFVGLLSIYNSVSYFADVLSYSRLLALGLATSALAFSVNLIASIASDMIPYIGSVIALFIIILGHTFNMAVNILGSFIHSARLQFVEFFGKFVSGGGKGFKPFREEERYVIMGDKI